MTGLKAFTGTATKPRTPKFISSRHQLHVSTVGVLPKPVDLQTGEKNVIRNCAIKGNFIICQTFEFASFFARGCIFRFSRNSETIW